MTKTLSFLSVLIIYVGCVSFSHASSKNKCDVPMQGEVERKVRVAFSTSSETSSASSLTTALSSSSSIQSASKPKTGLNDRVSVTVQSLAKRKKLDYSGKSADDFRDDVLKAKYAWLSEELLGVLDKFPGVSERTTKNKKEEMIQKFLLFIIGKAGALNSDGDDKTAVRAVMRKTLSAISEAEMKVKSTCPYVTGVFAWDAMLRFSEFGGNSKDFSKIKILLEKAFLTSQQVAIAKNASGIAQQHVHDIAQTHINICFAMSQFYEWSSPGFKYSAQNNAYKYLRSAEKGDI